MTQLFDNWPDPYERWFHTPIGALVKSVELDLVLKLLKPRAEEHILDAGCGSGIFTAPLCECGSRVTGLDLSLPMLKHALARLPDQSFLTADMAALPFADGTFDKVVSITALEFIDNGEQAIAELFRVTRPGGIVVVTTLNSLSSWAIRRQNKARNNSDSIFNHAWFRSPEQLLKLTAVPGQAHTAIHFAKDSDPEQALALEQSGQRAALDTGAFLAGCWIKPQV